MNFHDFVGRLFGFSNHRSPPRQYPVDDDDDDDPGAFGFYGDSDEDHDDNDQSIFFGDSNPDFFSETDDIFRHFEKHFHDMFKNFGFAEFPPMNLPSIGGPERPKDDSGSLRDKMLKPGAERKEYNRKSFEDRQSPLYKEWKWDWPYRLPRSHPHTDEKRDRDLDSEVSSGNLNDLLPNVKEDKVIEPRIPERRSYFRSVSVRTVRKPDGTVEERRTVKDEHGNVETTVTKTEGGASGFHVIKPEKPNVYGRDIIREPLIPDGTKSIFEKLFGSR
ncbi:HCLS1-associated protein X-1-like [Saccoglossus kowalevskii]|uniref:HCLS1-associated protein X-1-like n=1 Tax=Saccoglossus kowalevskii TaxID=10224 RepID=A0ABM0GLR5_SACKO|nr:PREDICTED: HCLS1-associated protein X-1-like [Saccoglossus kowalevskii]